MTIATTGEVSASQVNIELGRARVRILILGHMGSPA